MAAAGDLRGRLLLRDATAVLSGERASSCALASFLALATTACLRECPLVCEDEEREMELLLLARAPRGSRIPSPHLVAATADSFFLTATAAISRPGLIKRDA